MSMRRVQKIPLRLRAAGLAEWPGIRGGGASPASERLAAPESRRARAPRGRVWLSGWWPSGKAGQHRHLQVLQGCRADLQQALEGAAAGEGPQDHALDPIQGAGQQQVMEHTVQAVRGSL